MNVKETANQENNQIDRIGGRIHCRVSLCHPPAWQAVDELKLCCLDGYSHPRLLGKFDEEHGVKAKYELLVSAPNAINFLLS